MFQYRDFTNGEKEAYTICETLSAHTAQSLQTRTRFPIRKDKLSSSVCTRMGNTIFP